VIVAPLGRPDAAWNLPHPLRAALVFHRVARLPELRGRHRVVPARASWPSGSTAREAALVAGGAVDLPYAADAAMSPRCAISSSRCSSSASAWI
jgi:hypothetical protein